MFTYYSEKYGKQRTIDLNVQACLEARVVSHMAWRDIATVTRETRLARYGKHCTYANINDVRESDAFAEATMAFAKAKGLDVDNVLEIVMTRKWNGNGNGHTTTDDVIDTQAYSAETVLMDTLRKVHRGEPLSDGQRAAIQILEMEAVVEATQRENDSLMEEAEQLRRNNADLRHKQDRLEQEMTGLIADCNVNYDETAEAPKA